jgi:hypothetical protein
MEPTQPLFNEPDEIQTKDDFGNKVTYLKMNNGQFNKTTITNDSSFFNFLGDKYSIGILSYASTIKVYWENNHSERSLVRDQFGRLFHYRFEEEMNFDGGEDRIDITWTLVTDEKDSDELAHNSSSLTLLREPYVCTDENHWAAAHEYVNNKNV